uniref:Uncharacterized protein n=1 Tax=viral metagenome TaxID=1070528 RepID=A0A6C0HYZ9_9ZZZZ
MSLIHNLLHLPNELVLKIWSYTYSPQPSNLLEDIRDYSSSFDVICYYYFTKLMEDYGNDFLFHTYINWAIHDIVDYISFFKNDYEIILNETDYSVWRRCFQCKNMNTLELEGFIYKFEKGSLDNTKLRFLWGLLQPNERKEFIEDYEEFLFDDEEEEDEEEDFDY